MGDVPDEDNRSGSIGDMIGPYLLLEQLGEGGFGVVWRAEQSEPIHREVALKLIKAGMDSSEIIRRFEAERQTLALMDHPHIALVLDAGRTADGRPYFVMELVRGMPLTRYCDERKLPLRQRIQLFLPVCQAVHHAHQKATLHRDLKPSNILVTEVDGKPVPKVIDFGIAKVLDTGEGMNDGLTLQHTLPGAVIGTLQYMSPEQAGAAPDLDTRSDIYTLGVILYELLVGRTPLTAETIRKAAFDEVLRLVREAEIPRPSKLTEVRDRTTESVADCRAISVEKLRGSLRGDLDWIILKALEKERDRRFDSAAALARDLECYLADQPVEAGPPSAIYRFRKLVRRNRLAFSAGAMVLLSLVVGILISVWQWRQAVVERELKQAALESLEKEAEVSRAVVSFLTRDMLGAANPFDQPDRDLKVRDLLDRTSLSLGERFPNQPLVRASIGRALASSYFSVDETENALKNARESEEIFRTNLGPNHPKTLDARLVVLMILRLEGQLGGLETQYAELIQQIEKGMGKESWEAVRVRMAAADLSCRHGKIAEAEAEYRALSEIAVRNFGPTHELSLNSQLLLASLLEAQETKSPENVKLAEDIYRKQLALIEADTNISIAEHLHPIWLLANNLMGQRRWSEAEAMYRRAYSLSQQLFGYTSKTTFEICGALRSSLREQERYQDAVELSKTSLALYRKELPANHRMILVEVKELADHYEKLGQADQSAAFLAEYQALSKTVEPPQLPDLAKFSTSIPSNAWQLVFFPWASGSDPCQNLDDWRKCATGQWARPVTAEKLDFIFPLSGPEGYVSDLPKAGLFGRDRYGLIGVRKLPLSPGRWKMIVEADDGVRVWADGKLIVNAWLHPQVGTFTGTLIQDQPSEKEVVICVEYFQNYGGANLRFSLEREE